MSCIPTVALSRYSILIDSHFSTSLFNAMLKVNDIKLDIFDENIGSSKPIGSCSFSLLPFCDPTLSKSAHTTFELSYKVQPDPNDKNQFFVKSIPYGEITVKVNFKLRRLLLILTKLCYIILSLIAQHIAVLYCI